jgi:manganese/zinc/iron transport system substrate-binding protein
MRKTFKIWPVVVLLGGMLFIAGCGGGASSADRNIAGVSEYPYTIVCTVGMITDIVDRVAGDKANVNGLIGKGVDPHFYKPTRSDIAALMKADVVFYNGLMLEGKMAGILKKVGAGGRAVYAVAEDLDHDRLLRPQGAGGHFDPHVWMNPKLWGEVVQVVSRHLAKFDPPNADYYKANVEEYLKEIEQLDEYAHKTIATIPEKQRVLVTAHDAFNYFGRAYGVTVKGIQGISTESEAGLDDINTLIDFIVRREVRAIFVETSVADKNIRALLEGAKSRNHDLKIGGKLYSDAMGSPGTYDGTYVGMIDHNVTTIVRALGGEAPKKGMRGKLNPSGT